MRLFVIFDLPVVRKVDLQNYQRFRRFLLNEGYDMIQFSVYARLCIGRDDINKHTERLNNNLPPKGSVRIMEITEKQFAGAKILVGKRKPKESKKVVNQLTLFDDCYDEIFNPPEEKEKEDEFDIYEKIFGEDDFNLFTVLREEQKKQ